MVACLCPRRRVSAYLVGFANELDTMLAMPFALSSHIIDASTGVGSVEMF